MSARIEQARRTRSPTGSEGASLVWLDAVVSGICTPEAFLQAMRDRYQDDEEDRWEIVSLLDQYYRRGKIQADLFQLLKKRLETSSPDADGRGGLRARAQPAVSPQPVPSAAPRAPAERRQPDPTEDQADSVRVVPAPFAAAQPVPAEPITVPRPAPAPSDNVRKVSAGSVLRQRYRLLTEIGNGSNGTVFEALDEYRLDLPSTGQGVAVKVLHSSVAHRDEFLLDAQRQVQHLQLLSHPNIVRVHEFDRDGSAAFLTMELLSGMSLGRLLSARNWDALPRAHALAVMRDVGAAVAYAHSRGVLHGDLGPHNVFITNEGELRVLDFAAPFKQLQDRWSGDLELSKRAPVAAPGYASPQVLAGHSPDSRDDVFALASLSYLLLAGQHPFPNLSSLEASAQGLKPRRPPRLNSRQWRVLREGLSWEREQRPADVAHWLSRFELTGAAPRLPPLSTLSQGTPTRRRRVLLPAAAILLLVLVGAAGYWVATTDRDSLSRYATDWSARITEWSARISEWSARIRSLIDDEAAPPSAAAPATPAADEVQPPPAAVASPSAPAAASPAPAAASPAPALAPLAAAVPPHAPAAPAPISRAPLASKTPIASPAGGLAHIEFAATTVDVPASAATAEVTVRRTGNLHGQVAFSWWTESGTAKSSEDFAPVVPRVEHIPDGQASASLRISLSGIPHAQPRSFYVVIDNPDSGATLGKHTMTLVTLQPGN